MSCVLPYRGQDAKYAGHSEPSEPYHFYDSSSYEGQWRKQQWEDGGDWKHRKTGSGWDKGWSSDKDWVEVPDPKQLASNRMASRDRKRSPSKGSAADKGKQKELLEALDAMHDERKKIAAGGRAAGGSPKADRSSGSSKARATSESSDDRSRWPIQDRSSARSTSVGDYSESVASRVLECSHCRNHWGRADECIWEGTLDWQEGLLMCCCTCWLTWDENKTKKEKDFKTASKRSWRLRSSNAKQIARVQKFNQCFEENDRAKDETAKKYRKRLMNGAAVLTASFIKVFKMADKGKQKELLEALDAMHDERKKITANPDYVPLMDTCGAKLPWSVSQYICEITPMMSKYYLCRIVR
jgi:hypothetical protein